MQNYEQILAELGIEVPEDKKSDLKKKMSENYKTVADYDKQVKKKDEYKISLDDVQTRLAELEKEDVDGLKDKITTLTQELADEKEARAKEAKQTELILGSRHGRGFQSLQHDVDVIDPSEIPAVARRGRSYRLEGIGIISSRCTVGEITGIPITIIYRRIAVVIGRGGNGGIVEDGIAWPHISLSGLIGFESCHFTDGGSWSFIEKAVITSRKAYGQCGNGCIFCNLFHGSIVGFRV